MRIALAGKPEQAMPQPDDIVTATINPQNGLQTTAADGISEYFQKDTLPAMEEARSFAGNNANTASTNEEDLF